MPFPNEPDKAVEFKSLAEFSAIALVRINGRLIWRYRTEYKTSDYEYDRFSSLEDFEKNVVLKQEN